MRDPHSMKSNIYSDCWTVAYIPFRYLFQVSRDTDTEGNIVHSGSEACSIYYVYSENHPSFCGKRSGDAVLFISAPRYLVNTENKNGFEIIQMCFDEWSPGDIRSVGAWFSNYSYVDFN